MPIYSYECDKCGYVFNELVTSCSTITCPVCGSESLQKQSIYENNFEFKGPGFYETDYKRNKKES